MEFFFLSLILSVSHTCTHPIHVVVSNIRTLIFEVRIVKILEPKLWNISSVAGHPSKRGIRFQFLDEIQFRNTFGEQVQLHYSN